MAVKYVKDFDFPSSAGFHSGAKGYAKGGAVKAPTRTKSTMKREMTQSNKLSGNGALPRISDMDVNKQSGGAGKKLMPGYKVGGKVKAKFADGGGPGTALAIIDPVLKSESKAVGFPKKLPKFGRLGKLAALAAAISGAGFMSNSDDDVGSDETETVPVKVTKKEEIVTEPKKTESVTAPKKGLSPFGEAFKAARKEQGAGGTFTFNGKKYSTNRADDAAPSKPKVNYDKMSAMDAVLAYNKLHNKDFDDDMDRQIRDRFASPSEGGMKSGGKVSKYKDGGEKLPSGMASDRDAALAKRGIDPYEDRTRGLPSGSMSDLDAELISKELRQKYGKKENRSVMHPGGRQRFLLNQTEKAPMKRGGKAKSSKSDMQQDRALMARHNRLMHPDQKSKMKNGGKSVPSYSSKPLIKKSGGGSYNY